MRINSWLLSKSKAELPERAAETAMARSGSGQSRTKLSGL